MAEPPLWLGVWLYLLFVNVTAFAAMGLDKRLAVAGGRRISENTLLSLALFGGSPGTYLGRWYFRHKTRKSAFSAPLHLVALAQLGLLGWFLTGHSLMAS